MMAFTTLSRSSVVAWVPGWRLAGKKMGKHPGLSPRVNGGNDFACGLRGLCCSLAGI